MNINYNNCYKRVLFEKLKAAELKQKELAYNQLKMEGKLAQPSQTIIVKPAVVVQPPQQPVPQQQPQQVIVSQIVSNEMVNSLPTTSNDDHSNIQQQLTTNINQTADVITQNPPQQSQQAVVVMSMPPQTQLHIQPTIIQQIPIQYQQQQQPIVNNLETGKINRFKFILKTKLKPFG